MRALALSPTSVIVHTVGELRKCLADGLDTPRDASRSPYPMFIGQPCSGLTPLVTVMPFFTGFLACLLACLLQCNLPFMRPSTPRREM